MKTQQEILDAVKAGRESDCIDGRDYTRLASFFPVSEYAVFGLELKAGADAESIVPVAWTRENVLKQLASDVSFGFDKALGKRGLSAGGMNSVVKMWMWVLDDDLQHHDDYAQYGLPLLKAVAEKYGFENCIGGMAGNEFEFSAEADDE